MNHIIRPFFIICIISYIIQITPTKTQKQNNTFEPNESKV